MECLTCKTNYMNNLLKLTVHLSNPQSNLSKVK